jgi:ankyrin repeat protein
MKRLTAAWPFVALATASAIACAQGQPVTRCQDTDVTLEQALEIATGSHPLPTLPRLAYALGKDRHPQLKRLLAAGEDPNTCIAGASAMALVALTGDAASMRLLKEAGAHVDAPRNATGGTALFSALSAARWSSALLLLDWGADAKVADDGNSTAMHELAMSFSLRKAAPEPEHLQIQLAQRLAAVGTPIDARNSRGSTPLMFATVKRNYALANWLVQHGADPESPNDRGDTPVAVARRRNETVFIDLFEAAMARRRSGGVTTTPPGASR